MESILKYQIALTSVWWNDDYKEVRRFSSASDQEEYFDLENIFNDAPKVNFDIKDLMRPRIVFKEPNKDVFDVLNSNYLIVKDNHASSVQKYFFYFIDRIIQDSGDVYIATCKIDSWQTYQFIANIGEGLIERAHLKRFIYNPTSIYFDFYENSPLLIEEKGINEDEKLFKARYPIGVPFITSDNISLASWFANHVEGWLYVFFEAYKNYKGLTFGDTTIPDPGDATGTIYASGLREKGTAFPYSCLCLPIYRGSKRIFIQDRNGNKILLASSYDLFRYYNNGFSFIYSQKILPVNPLYKVLVDSSNELNVNIPATKLEINNGDLIIKSSSTAIPTTSAHAAFTDLKIDIYASNVYNAPGNLGNYTGNLFLGATYDDIKYINRQLLTSGDNFKANPFTFNTPAEIKTAFQNKYKRDRTLNPKLYGASYRQIRLNIANQGAATFAYNQLATTKRAADVALYGGNNYYIARASLVPETENLGLSPFLSSYLFNSKDFESVFGTVLTTDLSIAFKNNVYEQYLANNKNFWLQNKLNWQRNLFNIGAGSLISGDYTPTGAAKLVKSGINLGLDLFELKYKVNNMQNAPANYSAGSGSVSYALAYGNNYASIAYYADLYISPDCIIKRDDDYMYLYGYKYGRIDRFENVYNIRAYFNFVQGNFESISGALSDEIRRELYMSLNNGVRFWNVDRPDFDFDLENFENELIED